MWEKELEAAIEAGVAAIEGILKIYNTDFDVEIKEDNSPVTLADKNADKVIREHLHSKFPTYAFLTEESNDDLSRLNNDYVWIVDPVDGQKYGHVTYFFNGNRSGKFDETLDTYLEIRSDVVPFEQRPWMKCAEITDVVVDAIASGKYRMIRLNFPNGDMVGHTGDMAAVEVAMGALDLCLGRIRTAVEAAGAVLVISADHGNADDMIEHDKKGNVKLDADGVPCRKTSHSLNPVPCIVYDPESHGEYAPELREGLGISSLAATCIGLLGYEPPADYDPAVLQFR